MFECEFCKLNPSLHSFKVQEETDTVVTFYTLLGHTLGLTKQLIKMFGEYKNTFLEIKVINLNKFMKFLLNLSRPFMGNDIKNILHY